MVALPTWFKLNHTETVQNCDPPLPTQGFSGEVCLDYSERGFIHTGPNWSFLNVPFWAHSQATELLS